MNAGENPGVLNVPMILLLFGLMAFGWLWKDLAKLPRGVVLPSHQGERGIAGSLVKYVDGRQLVGIHGPPLIGRHYPQPLLVRTFG